MICADFDAYRACKEHAADVYRDRRGWARRAVFNIAGASRFSSDHTIRQYATDIWGIEPVKVDVRLLGAD
jgi:starch phosphorylase